jgi:hypothetical protein
MAKALVLDSLAILSVIFVLALIAVLRVVPRVVLLVGLLGFYLGASARCTLGLLYVVLAGAFRPNKSGPVLVQ